MDVKNVDRLQEIFRAVFALPADADVTGLRQMSLPAWDSLAHVSLVTAIESEFDVSLDVVDQLRLTSFNATLLLLEERGS